MKTIISYTNLILFAVVIGAISSCAHTRETVKGDSLKFDHLSIEIECIRNAMPSTSGDEPSSYLIVSISSTSTLTENIKLTRVEAIGPNGSWETTTFDSNDFSGKGEMGYTNNARGFDTSIGAPFRVVATVESDVNGSHSFEVDNVSVQTVY